MAELGAPRGGQQFWLTRGHLAALGLTTVSIAVLAFFVGVQVGKTRVDTPPAVVAEAFLPDPGKQDALEDLLREVERVQEGRRTPEDLSFVESLKDGEEVEAPTEPAPDEQVAAVEAGEDEPEAPPPPAPTESVVPRDGWAVQIAAFESAVEADALVDRLLGQGLPAYRIDGLVRGQSWYRVRVGGFADQDAAAVGMAELEATLGRSNLMVAAAP